MRITAVIATRNDPLLGPTIKSLRGMCNEVLVVDDASTEPIDTTGADGVIRNPHRLGPGPSRHVGALQVESGWILFCDSHMVFPEDWHSIAASILSYSDPSEIWGAVYHSDKIFNSFWHDTDVIGGADFYFWRHHDQQFSYADLSPRRPIHEAIFDVPCLLGGCYFVHSSWFRRMNGFSMMVGYGSEEAWLSWNTWLMGGHVRIMGQLKVTHIHQTATSTRKPLLPEWEINRMVVMKRILSSDQWDLFQSWLPVDSATKDMVAQIRVMTHGVDALTHGSVCEAFSLQTFEQGISLMQEFHSAMQKQCGRCRNRRWVPDGQTNIMACRTCNKTGEIPPQFKNFALQPIDL